MTKSTTTLTSITAPMTEVLSELGIPSKLTKFCKT